MSAGGIFADLHRRRLTDGLLEQIAGNRRPDRRMHETVGARLQNCLDIGAIEQGQQTLAI